MADVATGNRSLTHKRENDNGAIKDVPGILEVIQPLADQLEHKFDGENDDKDLVHNFNCLLHEFGLLVMFKAHYQRVETDHAKNEEVKFATGYQSEYPPGYHRLKRSNPII